MTNLTETQQATLNFHIPKRYADCDKEKVPQEVREKINTALQGNQGVYLHGSAGTGKTYIMYALLKNIILTSQEVYSTQGIYEVRNLFRVVEMPTLAMALKTYTVRDEDPTDTISLYKDCTYLFIDDLGAEKMTDFLFESFYQIINYRYNQMLPTIITSNYSLKEISEKINDRIASRIAEMCTVIKLEGEDKRI